MNKGIKTMKIFHYPYVLALALAFATTAFSAEEKGDRMELNSLAMHLRGLGVTERSIESISKVMSDKREDPQVIISRLYQDCFFGKVDCILGFDYRDHEQWKIFIDGNPHLLEIIDAASVFKLDRNPKNIKEHLEDLKRNPQRYIDALNDYRKDMLTVKIGIDKVELDPNYASLLQSQNKEKEEKSKDEDSKSLIEQILHEGLEKRFGEEKEEIRLGFGQFEVEKCLSLIKKQTNYSVSAPLYREIFSQFIDCRVAFYDTPYIHLMLAVMYNQADGKEGMISYARDPFVENDKKNFYNCMTWLVKNDSLVASILSFSSKNDIHLMFLKENNEKLEKIRTRKYDKDFSDFDKMRIAKTDDTCYLFDTLLHVTQPLLDGIQ